MTSGQHRTLVCGPSPAAGKALLWSTDAKHPCRLEAGLTMLRILLGPTAPTAVYAVDLYAQLLPLRLPRSRAARFTWTPAATAIRLLAQSCCILHSGATKLNGVFCCWLRVRILRGLHWACTVFCLLHTGFADKEKAVFLLEHATNSWGSELHSQHQYNNISQQDLTLKRQLIFSLAACISMLLHVCQLERSVCLARSYLPKTAPPGPLHSVPVRFPMSDPLLT